MTTVLVADDHPLFREAIADALRTMLHQVGVLEAGSMAEAIERVDGGIDVDLVLISTEGQKAIDVFHITRGGSKLSEEDEALLKADLERMLKEPGAARGAGGPASDRAGVNDGASRWPLGAERRARSTSDLRDRAGVWGGAP